MRLVAATSGWDELSIGIYVDRLLSLTSERALAAAIDAVMNTWRDMRRPPLAVILECYHAALAREPARRGLEEPVCSMERGLQIMWENYEAECRRQGREPDRGYFDTWQRSLGRQAQS